MLGNMSDPKAIGPAMAVALLTTLYGAFFANVFFGPIRTKLEGYTAYEIFYRGVVSRGPSQYCSRRVSTQYSGCFGVKPAVQAARKTGGGLTDGRGPRRRRRPRRRMPEMSTGRCAGMDGNIRRYGYVINGIFRNDFIFCRDECSKVQTDFWVFKGFIWCSTVDSCGGTA